MGIRPVTTVNGKQVNVSMSYKLAVLDVARKMSISTAPVQIMANTDVSEGARPEEVHTHGNMTQRAVTDESLAYLTAARAMCKGQRVIYLTVDGVAAGEESCFSSYCLLMFSSILKSTVYTSPK